MECHIRITCRENAMSKTVYAKTTHRQTHFEALPGKSFNNKVLDSLRVRRLKPGAQK